MSYKHFSRVERLVSLREIFEKLSILLKKGYSLRAVARTMGRSHSSVVRELKRNKVKVRIIF